MRVPDAVLRSVVFLGMTDLIGREVLLGTAFVFGRMIGYNDLQGMYLGTARHVIEKAGKESLNRELRISMNRSNGGRITIGAAVDAWSFHPDESVDLAVVPLGVDLNTMELEMIGEEMILSADDVRHHDIGVGDDVFLSGLFYNHIGVQRNVPIVRTGSIAAMPSERVRAMSLNGPQLAEAYLVEVRSIGGLSGSPVFVRTDGVRGTSVSMTGAYHFLGVIRGHWDEKFSIEDAVVASHIVGEAVNLGMAIVTPSQKLLEVTDLPHFTQARRDHRAQQETLAFIAESQAIDAVKPPDPPA